MKNKKPQEKLIKDPNTIDPEIRKLTKKLIKKYDKAWRELAKL